jgi:hypothetical protein
MPNPEHALAKAPPAWAETLVRTLDDGIRLPGTRIGVGLDAILGLLVPVVGDAATAVVSLALLVLAWRERVPAVTILRMVVNIAIDALLGAVPVAGDIFDLFWRSNRKNLALIARHQGQGNAEPKTRDYLVVSGAFIVAVAALATPILLVLLYGAMLIRLLAGS